MNSTNGKPALSDFFELKRAERKERLAVRPDRRRFRPAVSGLEDRKLQTSSATLSTVASFHAANSSLNGGVVMDGQGNLYGTTTDAANSGADTTGTVYEILHGSNTVKTLATFGNLDGYSLTGVSLDNQGNVYGAISGEGKNHGDGSVFEIARGSKTVTTLATFNGTNGTVPNSVVADGQGDVYGTTAIGGTRSGAAAFEIAHGSNTVNTLASFNTIGSAPNGVILDGQGNLFGVNRAGGKIGTGTVYEIARGSNTPTTLAAFPGISGSGISGLIMDSQGNLYGTTEAGGIDGDGTVFEIPHGSNTVKTLTSFDLTNGSEPDPNVGVVMDSQGNLYGTTEAGGASSDGTIFELARGARSVTFTSIGGTSGADFTGLILDGQGNLIGTTQSGGAYNDGRVFKFALNTIPK
jgi:uncharacterized repeat protein (TIGR03803 family)